MKLRIFACLTGLLCGSCAGGGVSSTALSCRGAVRVSNQYKVTTLVAVGASGPVISTSPLHCPNMEFRFAGKQANAALVQMEQIAAEAPAATAHFEITVVGDIYEEGNLRIPYFVSDKVNKYSREY